MLTCFLFHVKLTSNILNFLSNTEIFQNHAKHSNVGIKILYNAQHIRSKSQFTLKAFEPFSLLVVVFLIKYRKQWGCISSKLFTNQNSHVVL